MKPKWEILGIDHIQELPAVKWKLLNISHMDSKKHKMSLKKLYDYL